MTRHRPWRAAHPDAVIVDRRTQWGNPFTVAPCIDRALGWRVGSSLRGDDTVGPVFPTRSAALRDAVRRYRKWATRQGPAFWTPLAGRDLACWCPPGSPCHADVLLELASADPVSR